MMTLEALATAFDFTEATIRGAGREQWGDDTPCTEWHVQELINHTIGSVFGMTMAATGAAAPDGPGPDFTSGEDPAATFREAANAALAAWPEAMDKMVKLGPVELPGGVAAGINLFETLTHGWDIATATGQAAELPAEAAIAALAAARVAISEEARSVAGFAPEIAIGGDASPTDKLVAFLGRQP